MRRRRASSEWTVASAKKACPGPAQGVATSEPAAPAPNVVSTGGGRSAKVASSPRPKPATARTTTATGRPTMEAPEPRAALRRAPWRPDAAEAVASSTVAPMVSSIVIQSSKTDAKRSWVRLQRALRVETFADGRVPKTNAMMQRGSLRETTFHLSSETTDLSQAGVTTSSGSSQTARTGNESSQ
jgi:hypothetical protein